MKNNGNGLYTRVNYSGIAQVDVLAIILCLQGGLKEHAKMILISRKVGRNVGLGRVFAGGSDDGKVGYGDKA
jgi:hypothetical protein